MGVFAVLFGIIEIFVLLWIRGVQGALRDASELIAKQQTELSALRESVGRDYVPRTEHREMRDEFREGLAGIDRKLADINNKLYSKQEKQ
jgi:hypothetical protein